MSESKGDAPVVAGMYVVTHAAAAVSARTRSSLYMGAYPAFASARAAIC